VLTQALCGIEAGRLTVITPEGEHLHSRPSRSGNDAIAALGQWRALASLAMRGELGFFEAYIAGQWSTPNLLDFLLLADRNRAGLARVAAGLDLFAIPRRLRHAMNGNSRRGSRRNIAFHYDLGNAFYREWLDAGMSYSSALFQHDDQSLEEGQDAKIARIGELLGGSAGVSVLEIGCGWGALARRLAAGGAKVTAITLSESQLAFAAESSGNDRNRPDFRLQDYRSVTGSFDRVVSVEMLEAVGERYWPLYFTRLRELLKPGGRAVIQAITISEGRFADYRRRPDFIQSHVFPGGMLPTRAIVAEQAVAAGLRPVHAEHFGDSYARTLAEWRRRFKARWSSIGAMGYSERFCRLWEFYLAYCEVGFRNQATDVGLYVLER
jgi:cyclopropane-fatty-acyl-phospholipid synthase